MQYEVQDLKLTYERIVNTEIVTLDDDNYEELGFLRNEVTIDDDNYATLGYEKGDNAGVTYYYYLDEEDNEIVVTEAIYYYLINSDTEEEEIITQTEVNEYESYEHTLPPPSKFDLSIADVDAAGSGRSTSTGQMVRERIGQYVNIDIECNLIPNAQTRINLVRLLKQVPEFFYLKFRENSGSYGEYEFYRADITDGLYMFIENNEMWQGLSTSFVQSTLIEIDDSVEPVFVDENLEDIIIEEEAI